MKICTKCEKSKPLPEFYQIHTGPRAGKYHAACRKCQRESNAQRRASNHEKYKKTQRLYYRRNREYLLEKKRQWSANNPEKREEYRQRYMQKYPERHAAKGAVNDAIYRGHFPPAWTMVCDSCQEAQADHWHHHKGYSKKSRLDVVPLCTTCHGSIHAQYNHS